MITPRMAIATDLDALTEIWHRGYHEAHAELLPPALVMARTLESLRERLSRGLEYVRVVGEPGHPRGFCWVKADEVYQFYVDGRARGTSAASALMADAEERMLAEGVSRAWLACAIGNMRAARFYEKCGWQLAGTMINNADTTSGAVSVETWRYEKELAARS